MLFREYLPLLQALRWLHLILFVLYVYALPMRFSWHQLVIFLCSKSIITRLQYCHKRYYYLSNGIRKLTCYEKKKTCRRSNCAYNLDQNDIFSQPRDVKRLLKDYASASGDLHCVRNLTPFDTFYIKDQSNNLKGILMFEMAIEDPVVANWTWRRCNHSVL